MAKKEVVITIDGINYAPVGSTPATVRDGMKYVIARTYTAGVFAGYLETRDGKEVTLKDARRLWRWYGAASLSQLAMEGTKDPSNCKFPCAVDSVDLTEVIEILDCTEKARLSIADVAVWSA